MPRGQGRPIPPLRSRSARATTWAAVPWAHRLPALQRRRRAFHSGWRPRSGWSALASSPAGVGARCQPEIRSPGWRPGRLPPRPPASARRLFSEQPRRSRPPPRWRQLVRSRRSRCRPKCHTPGIGLQRSSSTGRTHACRRTGISASRSRGGVPCGRRGCRTVRRTTSPGRPSVRPSRARSPWSRRIRRPSQLERGPVTSSGWTSAFRPTARLTRCRARVAEFFEPTGHPHRRGDNATRFTPALRTRRVGQLTRGACRLSDPIPRRQRIMSDRFSRSRRRDAHDDALRRPCRR
jgi:hypothetical protein